MGRGSNRPAHFPARYLLGMASGAGNTLIEGFSPEISLGVTTRTVLEVGS